MGRRPTVMVVEDEAITLLAAASALRDAGYVVIEAASADEALGHFERGDGADLVFSDIETPGELNGLSLAATLAERWPEVRVILTSGRVKPSNTHPDVRFVGKPYDLDNVTRLIGPWSDDSA